MLPDDVNCAIVCSTFSTQYGLSRTDGQTDGRKASSNVCRGDMPHTTVLLSCLLDCDRLDHVDMRLSWLTVQGYRCVGDTISGSKRTDSVPCYGVVFT